MDAFARDGFVILADRLPEYQIANMRDELARVLGLRAKVMEQNRILERTEGTGHHLLEPRSCFLAWLSHIAMSPVAEALGNALGGMAILNSFGAVDNRKGSNQYVSNIHRDVRTFSDGVPVMVQLLLPLDEFSPATGSTWLLPGSHRKDLKPTDAEFYQDARQISAHAGQLIFFDSRLWHAAGVNRTDQMRRALTLTFTRPFWKPQFDYCRYLGAEVVAALPEPTQQLLGYFSRVPSTIEEWYQPPERRLYRPGQG
jgi:ectoine hydroxylase-related dioxygenase (phytanoyl-CoA dioxygenase family)